MKFKFELEQLVHYMEDNRPHSAPVLSRMMVENAHEDWVATNEQANLLTPFGKGGAFYSTCHGIYSENDLFGSKEDMANFICGAT